MEDRTKPQDIDKLIKEIDELESQQVDLLYRISGLTIDVLKEQATEEYDIIAKKIEEKNLERKQLIELNRRFLLEDNKIKVSCVIEALSVINDIDRDILLEQLKKKRIRYENISKRRDILTICKCFNIKLLVYNLNECVIDEINLSGEKTCKLNVLTYSEHELEVYDKFFI